VSSGLLVGVLGATGALGSEVLALLSESSLEISQLVAVATDRSLGQDLEFRGDVVPVETQFPRLGGLDLLLLCAPADVSLEYARQALRAEVTCVDVGGALASSPEVPLRVGALEGPEPVDPSPLIVAPPGAALPWALVLHPLHRAAGLRRVLGTSLEGASSGGREGIESLYQESIALFNQEDLPELRAFPRPVAFDCVPAQGEIGEDGISHGERDAAAALARVLGGEVRIALTSVQVPTFVGFGASAALETERGLDPKEAATLLEAAPGVQVWQDDADGATLRAAAGREEVLVGRLRRDPTRDGGLLLWLAADVLRVAAANAVRLAVACLGRHH
jgi:aspartate-semialdehyde dehydrogenase